MPGIFNFFSYACGHCYKFHPHVLSLRRLLNDKGLELIDVPVMLDPSHLVMSQAYYALERLGRKEDLHEELWHWLLYSEHSWKTTEDVTNEFVVWAKNKGFNPNTWLDSFHNQDVLKKCEWAQQTAASFQLTGTPAIGINGKYLTSPSMAKSYDKCIEIVLKLSDSS